jgi:hypothetical protein
MDTNSIAGQAFAEGAAHSWGNVALFTETVRLEEATFLLGI